MQKDVINVQIVRLCHNVYVKKKTTTTTKNNVHVTVQMSLTIFFYTSFFLFGDEYPVFPV